MSGYDYGITVCFAGFHLTYYLFNLELQYKKEVATFFDDIQVLTIKIIFNL
jgi:hypothetical protein